VAEDVQFKEGKIQLSDKPGLGLELNRDALDKYRVDHWLWVLAIRRCLEQVKQSLGTADNQKQRHVSPA
jgi:hypothetical protein